jgi:hypothetical protein
MRDLRMLYRGCVNVLEATKLTVEAVEEPIEAVREPIEAMRVQVEIV